MHCFWKASYLAVIVATCACQTETVVDPATVPSTENGAVAAGNRFFFVGGNALYELVQRRDGSSAAKIVVRRDDCSFTGLTASASTLYAACIAYEKPAPGEAASPYPPTAWSDLVRVELTRDQKRVSTTRAWGRNVLPNGMAVDARGDLYVSNSYSVIMSSPETPQPAVVRVRISGGKGFAIQQDTVVAGSEGGVFPNGLHIEGQRLWLVSNNVLFAADITDDGLANLAVVYTVPPSRMLDDLAMLPGNILVIAEIPAPELSGTSPWPPADAPGQLTFILVGQPTSPAVEAAFLGKHVFDHPITPSSVTVYQDEHGPALYVTDYFHGGLHRVSAAEWRNAGAIGGVLGSAAASTR